VSESCPGVELRVRDETMTYYNNFFGKRQAQLFKPSPFGAGGCYLGESSCVLVDASGAGVKVGRESWVLLLVRCRNRK
jgi:hypothetical protein